MTGSGLPHEPPSLLNPRVPLDLHGIANHPTQHAFLAAGIGALDATPSLGGDNIPRAIRATSSRGKQRRRPQTPPERRFKRPLKNSIQKETKERRPVEEERRRRRRPREKRGATAAAAAALMMRRIGRRFAGALLTGVAAAFLLQKKKRRRQDQTLNRVRP